MDFTNKIAIVTGGTGALGRVIVSRFAEEGMSIFVPVRSVDQFRKIFDHSAESESFKLRKIYGLPCDAFNENEVKEFVEDVIKQAGRIDYLVNTVGGYHPKRNVADTDTELLENQLKLNFFSTFYFTKYSLGNMMQNDFGRVVSIGSKPAIETTAGKFAYSVTKSGVVNLMQTIAEECKDNNITANVIIPSVIDTAANRESMKNADFSKWVNPEEIADTCLYLFSDAAKSLRGCLIKLYGKV